MAARPHAAAGSSETRRTRTAAAREGSTRAPELSRTLLVGPSAKSSLDRPSGGGVSGETGAANREVLAVSVGSGSTGVGTELDHLMAGMEKVSREADPGPKDKSGSDISILAQDGISIDGPARAFASVSKNGHKNANRLFPERPTMALVDPYSPCPCGSGQKYKWCCQKVEAYAERAQRLVENGQYRVGPEAIGRRARQGPGQSLAVDAQGTGPAPAQPVRRRQADACASLLQNHPDNLDGIDPA